MYQHRAGQASVEARHASVFDGEHGILAVSWATWRFNIMVHPIAPAVRGKRRLDATQRKVAILLQFSAGGNRSDGSRRCHDQRGAGI